VGQQAILSETPVKERRRVSELFLLFRQVRAANNSDCNLAAQLGEERKRLRRY
jgi:hypothetical protein